MDGLQPHIIHMLNELFHFGSLLGNYILILYFLFMYLAYNAEVRGGRRSEGNDSLSGSSVDFCHFVIMHVCHDEIYKQISYSLVKCTLKV